MAQYEESHRGRFGTPDPVAAQKAVSSAPRLWYQGAPLVSIASGKMARRLVTMTPQGLRPVGVLEERDGRVVLVKRVNAQRHLLKFPEESWALDASALSEAESAGADRVEVRDEATGNIWWTPLNYLKARGRRFDRGWGAQIALPLRYWSFVPGKREQNGQLALLG